MLWSLKDVSLPGRRPPRLDRVTIQIPDGVTAVLGPSGAGKTSLLNVLVEYERPSSGQSTFALREGQRATESGSVGMRRLSIDDDSRLSVFWSPPGYGLWPHLTAREHLETVRSACGTEIAEHLLSAFDLQCVSTVRPGAMSLGERSRLSVARALASGARVLVMDEPLAHVDPGREGKYWNAIRDYCSTTCASLVFSTHSPETALREASHVLCLKEGRVVYSGTVSDLYDRPPTQELALMLGPCNWLSDEEAGLWLGAVAFPLTPTPLPRGERGLKNVPDSATGESSPATSESNPVTGHSAPGGICIRPERLLIEASSNGPSRVKRTRFSGSCGEVELVREQDGQSRTFVHRPAGPSLAAGDRVVLKVVLLLMVLLMAGCDFGAEPVLAVKHEAYWNMPPDGPRVPAPRGMTVSPDDEYLVLDNAGRLLVFDRSGAIQRQWWMPETSVGKPEGVCVLKDGRIAVADTHYYRVVLFSHDGDVVGMFGKHGTEPGEFEFPVSVTQDEKENLYVCEYGNFNDRCQKFRPDGTFVRQIGSYGTADGQFQRPSGAAWFDGRLYIVDAFNNRIQVFDEDGNLIEILGKSDKISELYYPYDISVNDRGELFVVEYGAGRVSKFDGAGRLLGRYGHTGAGTAQFLTPWGMAIDHRGRVYVCDTGNRRIVELEL